MNREYNKIGMKVLATASKSGVSIWEGKREKKTTKTTSLVKVKGRISYEFEVNKET